MKNQASVAGILMQPLAENLRKAVVRFSKRLLLF